MITLIVPAKAEEEKKETLFIKRESKELITTKYNYINPIVIFSPILKIPEGYIKETIIKWANYYKVDPERLLRVAWCESKFRPDAKNGVYTGLFQFHPNTFLVNAQRCGSGLDIWNIDNQTKVAAWMFANHQEAQWSCK
jgi:soluble lytic murein transglycosylase-like protein